MKGRGGRGLGEVRGGLEGGEVREGSVTKAHTTVGTLHVIEVYTPVARARASLHARAGAPYTLCVARKTRLPCSLQSPLALYIRHMGTPFELRAFAMAFGTFLVRFQKIVLFQNFGGPFLPSQGAVPIGTEKSVHGRPM